MPEKFFPTKFAGYYVTENGDVYNTKKDELYKMNANLRGNPKGKKYQYPCINISIKDENGKSLKQIKYYVHRLIAETLIPNPNNYTDVDHKDRNKHNNNVSNLHWVTRIENMAWNAKPFRIFDKRTGKVYTGDNNIQWVRENWDWISKRTKRNLVSFVKGLNYEKRACGLYLYKE